MTDCGQCVHEAQRRIVALLQHFLLERVVGLQHNLPNKYRASSKLSLRQQLVHEVLVVKVTDLHEIQFPQQLVAPFPHQLPSLQLVDELPEVLGVDAAGLLAVDVVEEVADLLLELLLEGGAGDEVGEGFEGEGGDGEDAETAVDFGHHRLGDGDFQGVQQLRQFLSGWSLTSKESLRVVEICWSKVDLDYS